MKEHYGLAHCGRWYFPGHNSKERSKGDFNVIAKVICYCFLSYCLFVLLISIKSKKIIHVNAESG